MQVGLTLFGQLVDLGFNSGLIEQVIDEMDDYGQVDGAIAHAGCVDAYHSALTVDQGTA